MIATKARQAQVKPLMRLHVQNLRNSDVSALAVLLHMCRVRLEASWRVVNEGNADVLMMSDDDPNTLTGLLEAPLMTVFVCDTPRKLHTEDVVLSRPLHGGRVLDVLLKAEQAAGLGEVVAALTPEWDDTHSDPATAAI